MKIEELRQLTPKKLLEQLKKTYRELAKTRFHVQTGQEKNTAEIRKQRRAIAQIKTIQKEKELLSINNNQ